jgi:hypothetical protein
MGCWAPGVPLDSASAWDVVVGVGLDEEDATGTWVRLAVEYPPMSISDPLAMNVGSRTGGSAELKE